MHRPVGRRLRVWARPTGSGQTFVAQPAQRIERIEYQDAVVADDDNLNGQAIRRYDPSGLTETLNRDLDGNVRRTRRRLLRDTHAARVDWTSEVAADGLPRLEDDGYLQVTDFDALARIRTHVTWHLPGAAATVCEPQYDRGGNLASESLLLGATTNATGYDPATGTRTTAIAAVRYDASGRETDLELGNGTLTQYAYDEATRRLKQIFTTRPVDPRPRSARDAGLADPGVVQDLVYTHDAAGNVVECTDRAYMPVFWSGAIAEPRGLYEFDALYRLTAAVGRETAEGGLAAGRGGQPATAAGFPITGQTLRRYAQRYVYDAVGNLTSMGHSVTAGGGGWTRIYELDAASQPAGGDLAGGRPARDRGALRPRHARQRAEPRARRRHRLGPVGSSRPPARARSRRRRLRLLPARPRRPAGAQANRAPRRRRRGAGLPPRLRALPPLGRGRVVEENADHPSVRRRSPRAARRRRDRARGAGARQLDRRPHRRVQAAALPVREPPRLGHRGARRDGKPDQLRGLPSVRHHRRAGRPLGERGAAQALSLRGRRARRGERARAARGAQLLAAAGPLDQPRSLRDRGWAQPLLLRARQPARIHRHQRAPDGRDDARAGRRGAARPEAEDGPARPHGPPP